MPTTDIPVTDVTRNGVDHGADATEIAGDIANDHSMSNTGKEFISVRNSGASVRTVTLVTPGTVDGEAIADRTVSIAASATGKLIGPFPVAIYNNVGAVDKNKITVKVDHAELMLLAFRVP